MLFLNEIRIIFVQKIAQMLVVFLGLSAFVRFAFIGLELELIVGESVLHRSNALLFEVLVYFALVHAFDRNVAPVFDDVLFDLHVLRDAFVVVVEHFLFAFAHQNNDLFARFL